MNNPDIVERLEDYAEDDYYFDHKGSLVTTNRPIALREAAAEITRLREDNKKLSDKAEALRSVMIAAAEEIQAHWPAHCDAEGYGPANLMRRLEEGIPSQYAYTAGDFVRLRDEAEALRNTCSRVAADAMFHELAASVRYAVIDATTSSEPHSQPKQLRNY